MTLLARRTQPVVVRTRHARPTFDGIVAVSALVLTSVLLLGIAVTRLSPVFFGDEIGYLANAIALAGGPILHISASSYYPGWSLVLVPVWWLVPDPAAFYRIAVVLSAVSQIATVPVLAATARRLGVRRWHALTVGSVAVALPAHSLMANFALAESFLPFMLAVTLLLAVVAARRLRSAAPGALGAGTVGILAATGAAAGFTFTVHGRAAGVVVAAIVWGLALVVGRQWRAGSALILSTGLVAGLGYALNHHLEVVLYKTTGRESSGIAKVLHSQIGPLSLATSGLVWYVAIATAGLALPGVVLLVREVRREVRARRPGWACWAALSILGLAVVSIGYTNGSLVTRERLDIYVYGRYFEPATDVLAFLGLVLLARGTPSRRRVRLPLVVLVVFAGIAVGYGVLADRVVPSASHTIHGWIAMNVLGTVMYDWQQGHDALVPVLEAGLVAGGALAAILLLRRLSPRPTWLLAGALVFALAASVTGQLRTVVPTYGMYQHAFRLQTAVHRAGAATVDYDTAASPLHPDDDNVISQNAYQFFLAPRDVRVIDSAKRMPDTDLVIARGVWPAGTADGWKRVALDKDFDNALWVAPGEKQSALAKRIEQPAD